MIKLTSILISNSEENYATFSKKLIPDTRLEILGVRVPRIKNIAQSIKNDKNLIISFFNEKHRYYEEQLLHGLLLQFSSEKIEVLISEIDKFLPQLDNWAVCDSTVASLKIFSKHRKEVLSKVLAWLNSQNPYIVRFGIVTLLDYFINDEYIDVSIKSVSLIKSNNYYVNMAIAWFLSVSLIKFYDKTLPLLLNKALPPFIHKKTIQKAIDSFRISPDKKIKLKSLR